MLAHTAIWMATFAKRNVAEGRAVVVQLVVCEGAWIIFVLVCQWPILPVLNNLLTLHIFKVSLPPHRHMLLYIQPTLLLSLCEKLSCSGTFYTDLKRNEFVKTVGQPHSCL